MTADEELDALRRQVRLMETALDVNEQEIVRLTAELDAAKALLADTEPS